MATFQAQVEGLTQLTMGSGDAPSTSELTQFLVDGVLDATKKWLIGHPQDRELFMDETILQVAQGANLDGAEIISVVRADGVTSGDFRPCRRISPAQQTQVLDTESLSFASKYHPAYMLNTDNTVKVFPVPADNSGKDSYKIYYINNAPKDGDGNALTFADSTLRSFPADKVYLVVLYASIQSLQAAMSNSVISLSITSPTVPVLTPISLSSSTLTFNTSVPTALSASVLNSPGVDTTALADITGNVPIYIKPVMSDLSAFSSFTSSLSETDPGQSLVFPPPPTAPSIGTTSVTFSQSAPVFAAPTTSKVTTYIETNQDVELANAKLQEINTNMQAALNTFNERQVEYQAQLQISSENARFDNEEDARKFQKYQIEVSSYQAQVNTEVQGYQAKLSQYSLELNMSVQAWQKEESDKISQYQADIQNELNEFNKQNAKYQANIQAEITKAQIDAQEYQKEGDLTFQASVTEYANNLQKYQADISRYSASIAADVQEFQQELESSVQSSQADMQDNTAKISKYQAEVADYQAEVAKEIQESTTKTQQYQSLYVQLLQQYNGAFQVAQPQQQGAR